MLGLELLPTPVALSYGIFQGSVLSPFLFNIYTGTLSSVPKSCNLESYVDEIILMTGKHFNRLHY